MIVIRTCRGLEELEACVDLQVEVWGYSDGDVIPRRVFLVAQKIGGQVIGAFDTDLPGAPEIGNATSMIGFALSLPGVKTGTQSSASPQPQSYLHSHMLAVRESYRNQKIGAQLKLAQREDALTRGIERMEWTFDPLEIKNAYLNIHKLGAIVRRYEPNFYGVSSSRLQGGLPTDRLVAEWWLNIPRVLAAISEDSVQRNSQSVSADELVDSMQIVVPAEIYHWKSEEATRALAVRIQAENRLRFEQAFAAGLAVIGCRRNQRGDGVFQLGPWREPGAGRS
uniref:GCN5-related N-acetyltransferase n=1 Tax=mine drainage metagenome TaxID=410659 RepID=E6QP28_9ZZZZ